MQDSGEEKMEKMLRYRLISGGYVDLVLVVINGTL